MSGFVLCTHAASKPIKYRDKYVIYIQQLKLFNKNILTIVYVIQYNATEVIQMEDVKAIVTGMEQELRRGTMTLCVLSRLKAPKYGYALVEELAAAGLAIEPGTLYPLLRRLEAQGLLTSEWETSGAKPRKYYVRSAQGETVYGLLCGEWDAMTQCIDRLIHEEEQSNEQG